MEHLEPHLRSDVEAINSIPATASILEIICQATGMGFAAVARVTDKQWIACSVKDDISFGLQPGGELELETTICNEIRTSEQEVVIDDVDKDEKFCRHHTPAKYGFKSYISIPIFRRDKSFFGTLCAIDPKPAKLNRPEIIGMFKMFADLIAFHLSTVDQLNEQKGEIESAKTNAELREQFIAILGHDLRNPLSAIGNSAEVLASVSKEGSVLRIANIIKSSTSRMNMLVTNMLDFASGRLGGGIRLEIKENIAIEQILKQVITETLQVWPGKNVVTAYRLTRPVSADGDRIAQLFLNLLRNAFTYGREDAPVTIQAETSEKEFLLTVSNEGKAIPAAVMQHLFQPFFRGQVNNEQKGLGLGLFIAHEIAKAHGGKLSVSSDDKQTIFTLTLPLTA